MRIYFIYYKMTAVGILYSITAYKAVLYIAWGMVEIIRIAKLYTNPSLI
jgi:hypothetical protein